MRRTIILITTLTLLVGGTIVYFFFFKDKKTKINWKTVMVEKGDVVLTVTATGSLNALTTVDVGTQVNGTIAKLYSDFNSPVKAGQVIARLDTTFLAAAKEDAEAIVQKAEVQANESKIEYERSKALVEKEAIPKSEYDLANSNYQSSLSTLRSARAQLNRAKINLQYAIIKAPINGVVISRNVDVGQTVISSFNSPVLFTIANDLTKMELIANVDEADIGQVKVGQDVIFSVDAYPEQQFYGKVRQIRLQPIILQNVVNYAVIINVPNPELKLMPGLTANINFKIAEDTSELKVPVSALNATIQKEFLDLSAIKKDKKLSLDSALVLIKKGDAVVPVYVATGLADGSFVVIKGNVKEGDEIITGVLNGTSNETQQAQNPFMPKFPAHGRR